MKNLFYALFLGLIITSCGENKAEQKTNQKDNPKEDTTQVKTDIPEEYSNSEEIIDASDVDSLVQAQYDKGVKIMEVESYGGIKINDAADNLAIIHGEPTSKSEFTFNDLVEKWQQDWEYPNLDLKVTVLGAVKTDLKIFEMRGGKNCPFTLASGIKTGSKISVVEEVYKEVIGSGANPDQIVLGSIYDGIFLSYENNEITEIYFGATAE